jgi:AraC-like DNA-binding protein
VAHQPSATNQFLLLSADSRLRALNGGLFVSPGGGLHPKRVIQSFELILVRSGKLHLWERQTEFHLSAGDALLLWPDRPHGPLQEYDRDTSFYWVHFELTVKASSQHVRIPQLNRLGEPLRLVELFHRFLDDQENQRLEPNYGSALVKLMLFETANQPRYQPASSERPHNLPSMAQVLITKRFREPVSTSTIAAQLHCNPDYLGRTFRKTFGFPVTEGIHRVRMQHAKSLLLLTSMTIKEIATHCGYENVDYFRRLFRRFFDMQPNQFRSLHLKQHTNAS